MNQKEYKPNEYSSAKRMVLKVLSPYFIAGRFKEKSLFKEMARKLTLCLYEEMIEFYIKYIFYNLDKLSIKKRSTQPDIIIRN